MADFHLSANIPSHRETFTILVIIGKKKSMLLRISLDGRKSLPQVFVCMDFMICSNPFKDIGLTFSKVKTSESCGLADEF